MKKLFFCIICFAIAAYSLIPAGAAVLRPAFKMETGEVDEGIFPVYIYLIDCKGLSACDLLITFNSGAIVYEDCEEGCDTAAVGKTTAEKVNYSVNPISRAGLRLSFFFQTALATADEYAANAKNGETVNVNTSKFQAFVLYFSIPENGADTADIKLSAKTVIKQTEKVYTAALTFKPSSLPVYVPLRGDVDLDKAVTAADARIVLRCAVKLETLTGRPFRNADMDNDGIITSADARRVLRVAVKLPEV